MKEFFRSFFASLLAIIVSGIIGVLIIVGIVASLSKSMTEKENKRRAGDVLVIDLSKKISELGEKNTFALLADESDYKAGLYDVLFAIHHAQKDNNVKGIVLKLAPSPNGWATLQQLREALIDFKSSGKFIYSYGELITQGAYMAASASDSIFLNPAGYIELKGFATELTFFKGTLDKLELQPEIFYAGKFKSATEPFRADKMSEPNKIQVKAMQDGLWDQYTTAVSAYTHTDKGTVNQWAQTGAIQFPADALKYKLVAGLRYWDEVESLIRAKTGRKESDDMKYVSINDYASTLNDDGIGKQRIALLIAEGNITDGEQNEQREIASRTLCEQIRKIRLNDKIKGVVLRVNSPGGSALASEVILRELVLLKQKKPLVVSMGDYAASGGYYISSMADSIFALPNTITGSIGVFGMLFNVDKLMKNKLGVTFDGVKNAPYADFPTAMRPLTADEAERMQKSIDTIYAKFKNHVVQGRKLKQADVDSIAQGRVWTGTDALKIGLVDRIGGLSQAIASAASLAKITDYRVVTYPEPMDKLSSLMKKLNTRTEAKAAIKDAMKEEMGDGYDWMEKLRSLQLMNGKAMMAMPFVMKID